MSCHRIEPSIVDLARGVRSDPGRETALQRHLHGCPSCAGIAERERAMSAALRRLGAQLPEPPPDSAQEAALLAAFDQGRARTRRRAPARVWASVAAATLLGAVYIWRPARTTGTGEPVAARSVVVGAAEQPRAPVSLHVARTAETSATVARRRPQAGRISRDRRDTPDTNDFVAWPGAAAWPPFESGELVRVELPVDALSRLGIAQPAPGDGVVQAEVLVGQDGFARAIRLVQ